jgi:hypothetical protein
MNIPLIMAKVSVLRFHPEWVDGGPVPGLPGGPVIRTALTEYVVAGLIREIGLNLSSREFVPKLQQTAKELVAEAGKRLPATFESGESDDLCPPYWRHYPPPPPRGDQGPSPDPWQPGPIPWVVAGPQPDPWLEAATPGMKDAVLAGAIRDLASVTTIEKASSVLKEVGEAVMKQASGRLFDEYCGTPVKPRVPVPRPKATAA